MHRRNKSRQFSAVCDFVAGHFDILAGVLFDDDYNVMRAALIPRAVIEARSKYIARTNSNKFILRDEVWLLEGEEDVMEKIRGVPL